MEGYRRREAVELLTAHPAHRLHSQLNYAELVKNMRLPIVNRSLFTPKMLLIWYCEWRSGACLEQTWSDFAGAVVTDGIKKGVVCVHEGAGQIWKMAYVKTAVRTC